MRAIHLLTGAWLPLVLVTCIGALPLQSTPAARGIASLRYDKRGIEESAAAGSREEHARFDHMVDDAAAILGLRKGWARKPIESGMTREPR